LPPVPLQPGDVVRAYAGTKDNRPCIVIKARDGDVWLASAGQGLRHATRDLEVDPSILDEMGLDKPTFFEAKVSVSRRRSRTSAGRVLPTSSTS